MRKASKKLYLFLSILSWVIVKSVKNRQSHNFFVLHSPKQVRYRSDPKFYGRAADLRPALSESLSLRPRCFRVGRIFPINFVDFKASTERPGGSSGAPSPIKTQCRPSMIYFRN
jgi:hypothetical protein